MFATRASGTGNTAREAIYVDGMLISNFLGNGTGGLGYSPAWGFVIPEEIERVDMMYGPFSAAYPGNSIGAAVDFVTKIPAKFEFYAKAGYQNGDFSLFNSNVNTHAYETSASVGNKIGDFSFLFGISHLEPKSPPKGFATRLISHGVVGTAGTAANGALQSINPTGQSVYIIGTGNN